jgi:hypothetical protein
MIKVLIVGGRRRSVSLLLQRRPGLVQDGSNKPEVQKVSPEVPLRGTGLAGPGGEPDWTGPRRWAPSNEEATQGAAPLLEWKQAALLQA